MAPPRRSRTSARTNISKTSTADTSKEIEQPSTITQRNILEPSSTNPPKIFILPGTTTEQARILSSPHPRTLRPNRYFFCPLKGFFEFTKIAAPKTIPRSFLISPSASDQSSERNDTTQEHASQTTEGYVSQSAEFYIATPFDPVFLLLPILDPPPAEEKTEESHRKLFLTADDYLDSLADESPHLRLLLANHDTLRKTFESRLAAVCDTVDAGDEIMYRFSLDELVTLLIEKCRRIVKAGLPPSMEERIVRKELQVPISSLKRGESNAISEMEESMDGTQPELDSQTSVTSNDTVFSAISNASSAPTEVTVDVTEAKPMPPPIDAPEGVCDLLRLQTILFYILNSYVPTHIGDGIRTYLASPKSPVDFSPLTTHLTHLSNLRRQAHMSNDTFTMKRSYEDEEEQAERRAKKARLEEEEKKRKAGMSRGVKLLAKVNTRGMKKMSDFFGKKA